MHISIYVLLLFGTTVLPLPNDALPNYAYTGILAAHELKTFQFADREQCDNAARLMYKSRDVGEAFCIEVRP
jgi:hypothetical protein